MSAGGALRGWFVVETGVRPAGVAVVALEGQLEALLGRVFDRRCGVGRLTYGRVVGAGGETIDDAVVARWDDRRAELSLHGGREVVRRACELLRAHGFEERGVAEGSLEWALMRCRTAVATRAVLGRVDESGRVEVRKGQAGEGGEGLYWLLNPPRVAVVGLANVGKSTLVNALAGRAASIVADLPGTTRDYVVAEADLDGLIVELADTPGVREGAESVEAEAMEIARGVIASADAWVIVLDGSREVSGEEVELLGRYGGGRGVRGGGRTVVVVNRVDLARGDWGLGRDGRERGEGGERIATVATRGEGDAGVRELRRRLRGMFLGAE